MNALKRPALPLSWIGVIAAAEVLGRRSPSDVWDAIGVCVLATLVATTIVRLEGSDGAVAVRLRRAGRGVRRRLASSWPDMGVDFRGDPPVSRGFPDSLLGGSLLVAGLAAATFGSKALWPGPARELALAVSPTVYFLALAVGWGALVSILGGSTFSVWRDLNDHLTNRTLPSARRQGIAIAAGLAWLGLIAALVFLAPLWLAWVICVFVAGLGSFVAWAIDRHEKVRIVWRSKRTGKTRLFHAGASIRWDALTMTVLLLAMTIPATGVGWGGRLAGTTPITIGLGLAAMWAGVLAFLSYTAHGAVRMLALARHDPSRREPIPLILEQDAWLSDSVEARLEKHGFRTIREGHGADQDPGTGPAVRVSVDDASTASGVARLDREAGFLVFAPRVRVPDADMGSLTTLVELRRLDNAILRDRLLEGLRRLLDLASRRRFANGTGFWLVPHIWYARGLTRDSDDPDYHSIGPPYHKVIPRRARQHLHRVLQAMDVDLVFAEDSAPLDEIEPVFERIFDVYDLLGPRRIEEHDFAGLQRVKVILHDFTLGEPMGRGGYPEPSYEEIGRARILHIMRDRGGGQDEYDPTPAAPERRPRLLRL